MKRWMLKTKSLGDVSKSINPDDRQQTTPRGVDHTETTSPTQKTKPTRIKEKPPLKTFNSLEDDYDQEHLNKLKLSEARNVSVSRSGRFKEKQRMRIRVVSIDGESLMADRPPGTSRDCPPKVLSAGDADIAKKPLFIDAFTPPPPKSKVDEQLQQEQQRITSKKQINSSFPRKPNQSAINDNRLRPSTFAVLSLSGVEGSTSQL